MFSNVVYTKLFTEKHIKIRRIFEGYLKNRIFTTGAPDTPGGPQLAILLLISASSTFLLLANSSRKALYCSRLSFIDLL